MTQDPRFTHREWWDLLGQYADPITRVLTPEKVREWRMELRRRGWHKADGVTS